MIIRNLQVGATQLVILRLRLDNDDVALLDSVRRLAEVQARLMPPYGPIELPAPVPSNEPLNDIAAGYAAFLRIADGAACGSSGEIRLWPAAAVRQLQSVTDNLPGAGERWCAVADVVQNPVVVEYATGEVWWFSDLNIVWYTDTQQSSFAKLADNIAASSTTSSSASDTPSTSPANRATHGCRRYQTPDEAYQ